MSQQYPGHTTTLHCNQRNSSCERCNQHCGGIYCCRTTHECFVRQIRGILDTYVLHDIQMALPASPTKGCGTIICGSIHVYLTVLNQKLNDPKMSIPSRPMQGRPAPKGPLPPLRLFRIQSTISHEISDQRHLSRPGSPMQWRCTLAIQTITDTDTTRLERIRVSSWRKQQRDT